MNILDKTQRHLAPIPHAGKPVLKRDKYQWATPGEKGSFMIIRKELLNIEDKYQRDKVSDGKIMEIARNWDWKLIGAISVVRRRDETFWVFDGGHRARAAFLRDDIESLPCMVFKVNHISEEAKAFIGTNTMCSNVSALQKHIASVTAGEPLAVALENLLEKHGFKVGTGGGKNGSFVAIKTLRDLLTYNLVLAERVFETCVKIAGEKEVISGMTLNAIFWCQVKLSYVDILSGEYLQRLIEVGIKGIDITIKRKRRELEKASGNAVGAQAVLDLLNKGKRTRRLSFQ